MDPWKPTHSLGVGHAAVVWLLNFLAAAAWFLVPSDLAPDFDPWFLPSTTLVVGFTLASLGWPDWLSQGLRRFPRTEAHDDSAARARVIVCTLVTLAASLLTSGW